MTTTQPRTKTGKFRSLRQAERIQRLAAKGVAPREIAKVTGVRYQTIWRTLNRNNRKVVNAAKVEKADELEGACNNEYCMSAQADLCECQCNGAFHQFFTRHPATEA